MAQVGVDNILVVIRILYWILDYFPGFFTISTFT